MSADDRVTVGKALPRLGSVSFHNGYEIAVTWDGATRGGRSDIVDLATLLFRLKFYAPLRDNRDLMSTVHTIDDGTAIAWGDDDIDMAATSVLNLAEETMAPADFVAFMKRNNFTFDRVAAELGISKRLAGYYAKSRSVPRYIALACNYIDKEKQRDFLNDVIKKYAARTNVPPVTGEKTILVSNSKVLGSISAGPVVVVNNLSKASASDTIERYADVIGLHGTKVGTVEHIDSAQFLVSDHFKLMAQQYFVPIDFDPVDLDAVDLDPVDQQVHLKSSVQPEKPLKI